MGKIGRTYPAIHYASQSEQANSMGPTGTFDPAGRTIAGGVIGLLVVLGLLGWLLTHWAS